MKKTVFLILALMLLGSFLSSSLLVQGAEKACGGGVNIFACPDRHGCIIPQSGGSTIYFATDKNGSAIINNLCAGNYFVCVEDCGTGKFYSDGASEIVVYITNGADCHCP